MGETFHSQVRERGRVLAVGATRGPVWAGAFESQMRESEGYVLTGRNQSWSLTLTDEYINVHKECCWLHPQLVYYIKS